MPMISSEHDLNLQVGAALVFGYVFTAVGFSGVPQLSRMPFFFIGGMLLFVCRRARVIKYDRWLTLPGMFLVLLIAGSSFYLGQKRTMDMMLSTISAFGGGMLLAILLKNGISVKVVKNGLIYAVWVNIAAALLGFNAMSLARGMDMLKTRASGLTGDANEFAIKLTLTGFFVLLSVDKREWFSKFSIVVFAVYAILATGSRTGLILGVLFLCTFMVFEVRNKYVILAVLIICLLMPVASSVFEFEDIESYRRMKSILDDGVYHNTSAGSAQNRLGYIEEGIDLWLESPIYGHGLEQFYFMSREGSFSHNNFIELLVSVGVVGFICYYALHFMILWQSLYCDRGLRGKLIVLLLALLLADMLLVLYYVKHTIILLFSTLAFLSRKPSGSTLGGAS